MSCLTKKFILFSSFIIVLFCIKNVAAFDISNFDPAGRLCRHMEGSASKLNVRGFYLNRTDIDLHGRSHDAGKGDRVKDWDFQMIENDIELEFRYKISDHLELINIEHFLYDALYNLDGGAHFPRSVKRRLKRYDSFKEIVRELYLNINYKNWFIKLGKQQVVWGKMDGKCIDIINPEDRRESVNTGQDDYEWRRIPTWMANATYFWSDYYFQFIWVPDFEPSMGPSRGSVWWYPALSSASSSIVEKRDEPSTSFKDHEFAIRLNMVKKGWDLSFIYFYTWDDYPTMFTRGYSIDPATGDEVKHKEPVHTRLHQFGFNVDKGNWFLERNWVWRMEFLYTLNDYVSASESLPEDGVAKRDNLKSISSIETCWWHGEIKTLFQFNWKYQFGYDSRFRSLGSKMKRFDSTVLLSLSEKWLSDRLKLTVTFYYRPGEGSFKFKDTLSWAFSDYISAHIRYTGYTGPSDDIYGMYNKWDNIGFEIKYSF